MDNQTALLIEGLLAARVLDLSQPLDPTIPPVPSVPPFTMGWVMRHGDYVLPGGTSFTQELVSMGTHTGTHIDALNHVSCDGRLHGEPKNSEAPRGAQPSDLAIEHAPFIHAGVVLDIPALRGVDRLAPGDGVTGDDLDRACAAQSVTVEPGAAVLVRTGWGDRETYRTGGYLRNPPGVNISGARRLIEWQVALTGADTFMYEQPSQGLGPMPVHATLAVEAGVHIVENLFLEELVQAEASTFALIVAPLRMTGASGSPIRPLALVSGTDR